MDALVVRPRCLAADHRRHPPRWPALSVPLPQAAERVQEPTPRLRTHSAVAADAIPSIDLGDPTRTHAWPGPGQGRRRKSASIRPQRQRRGSARQGGHPRSRPIHRGLSTSCRASTPCSRDVLLLGNSGVLGPGWRSRGGGAERGQEIGSGTSARRPVQTRSWTLIAGLKDGRSEGVRQRRRRRWGRSATTIQRPKTG